MPCISTRRPAAGCSLRQLRPLPGTLSGCCHRLVHTWDRERSPRNSLQPTTDGSQRMRPPAPRAPGGLALRRDCPCAPWSPTGPRPSSPRRGLLANTNRTGFLPLLFRGGQKSKISVAGPKPSGRGTGCPRSSRGDSVLFPFLAAAGGPRRALAGAATRQSARLHVASSSLVRSHSVPSDKDTCDCIKNHPHHPGQSPTSRSLT